MAGTCTYTTLDCCLSKTPGFHTTLHKEHCNAASTIQTWCIVDFIYCVYIIHLKHLIHFKHLIHLKHPHPSQAPQPSQTPQVHSKYLYSRYARESNSREYANSSLLHPQRLTQLQSIHGMYCCRNYAASGNKISSCRLRPPAAAQHCRKPQQRQTA